MSLAIKIRLLGVLFAALGFYYFRENKYDIYSLIQSSVLFLPSLVLVFQSDILSSGIDKFIKPMQGGEVIKKYINYILKFPIALSSNFKNLHVRASVKAGSVALILNVVFVFALLAVLFSIIFLIGFVFYSKMGGASNNGINVDANNNKENPFDISNPTRKPTVVFEDNDIVAVEFKCSKLGFAENWTMKVISKSNPGDGGYWVGVSDRGEAKGSKYKTYWS